MQKAPREEVQVTRLSEVHCGEGLVVLAVGQEAS